MAHRLVCRAFVNSRVAHQTLKSSLPITLQTRHLRSERRYVPRRALLFVPASDESKLKKTEKLDVDCVALDCEDGVALSKKDEARTNIRNALDELDFGRKECMVRVNSVGSGLTEEDLRVTLSAKKLPDALMLPKVESVEQIDWFAGVLKCILDERKDAPIYEKINLVILVESAVGLLNLKDICMRGTQLSLTSPFHLDGVTLGSEDFRADIGASRTEDSHEIMYARQKIVVIAKAFQLQALDSVNINFKDTAALERECTESAILGHTGKQIIHPLQIPVVQKAFTPSAEKVEWATELIKEFDRHQELGKGAFTFRGSMIDMPLLLQARNIVQLREAIKDQQS